jgi:predicted nucleic acid-binding protein
MSESILMDTGAVIALLDFDEAEHTAVKAYWGQRLLLPVTLLAEIDS